MCKDLTASAAQVYGHHSQDSEWKANEAHTASHPPPTFPSIPFIELNRTLPSHPDVISPFVDQVMRFVVRFRGPEEDNFELELALREALVNAIVHGNQKDAAKCVYVNCRFSANGAVSLTIKDEGRGFASDAVADPTLSDNLLRSHGRGIYLIRRLMDEVEFEKGGSVVHMRKRASVVSDSTRRPQ